MCEKLYLDSKILSISALSYLNTSLSFIIII